MENKQNLSKLKKQDILNKKGGKAPSAEKDLRDNLTNGDKSFTDETATNADSKYGVGNAKFRHIGKSKFATTSKSDPSNSKLDGEGFLSDKLTKGDKKFTDQTATNADNKVKDNNATGKGTHPATKDHNLSTATGSPKKMTNSPSIKGKSTPSNAKLDSESYLADNFTYLMNFNTFVNEAYESDSEDTNKEAEEDDSTKKEGNEEDTNEEE